MLCRIAQLLVDVPGSGDLPARCQAYLSDDKGPADIVICKDRYRRHKYHPNISDNMLEYMESAYQFYYELMKHEGMYLHASAVVLDGRAYLFSGHCGAGKSTHTRLWQSTFGDGARVINDDKPALRRLDGRWYAYGTPWCGKDGININEKAPLAGICFVKKANENKIRRLSQPEAMEKILAQTIRRFHDTEMLDVMLGRLACLLEEIPVYELENRPESAAAILSYETMSRGAEDL